VLTHIPEVLSAEELGQARCVLSKASWIDGTVTAGHQSARVKRNMQADANDPAARDLSDTIIKAVQRHPYFISAALPFKIFPPLFNRYDAGQSFGTHIDNAVRHVAGTPHQVRTDLSATLFLSPPDEYDGGELLIEDHYGVHKIKLPAGDLILYPAGSLHQVTPVTRGARLAAFFWIQSMVRDDGARTLLFDLDSAIRQLGVHASNDPAVLQLTGVYHNLLRRWAEV
jgi:PKHD-type hydroxylase